MLFLYGDLGQMTPVHGDVILLEATGACWLKHPKNVTVVRHPRTR